MEEREDPTSPALAGLVSDVVSLGTSWHHGAMAVALGSLNHGLEHHFGMVDPPSLWKRLRPVWFEEAM